VVAKALIAAPAVQHLSTAGGTGQLSELALSALGATDRRGLALQEPLLLLHLRTGDNGFMQMVTRQREW